MLGNSPISDLSAEQWQKVTAQAVSREFAVEQIIEKPTSFAIWLIDSGGVCIIRGQERHYYQQGQIMAIDGMMGEFSVSNNTRLLCLDGAAMQTLCDICPETTNFVYNLAAKQQFQSEVLELIERYCGPLRLAHRTEILAACQWQSVAPGDVLVNRGERCFHWHIVLHGKLCGMRRSLCQSDVDHQLNDTIEQQVDFYRLRGDCFGQTALLGNGEYQMAFVAKTAVRLVKFKRDIFDLLWQHYDNFKQIIATELAMSHAKPLHPKWGDKIAFTTIGDFKQSHLVVDSLAKSHKSSGELIDFERLALKLGLPLEVGRMVRHPGWYSVYRWWQDNLEQDMFLVTDSRYPAWQTFCAANAKRIIGLLDATEPLAQVHSEQLAPRFGIERWLLICHQPDVVQPKGTVKWLKKFAEPHFLHWRFDHQFDSARVMRTIKGQGIALVLGGCYRTAVAQLGVLKQMQLNGFHADLVVGNGFATLVAAFYALSTDNEQLYQQMVIKPHNGINSLRFGRLTAKNTMVFQNIFNACFQQVSIEDMWLPFACTGTDREQTPQSISKGKLRHAFRKLNAPFHRTANQTDNRLEIELIRRYSKGKVVLVDICDNHEQSSTGGLLNPLNRWFDKNNKSMHGQFAAHSQSQDDEDDESIDKRNQLFTLHLQIPMSGSNSQNFLDRLIQLGHQQAIPLLTALASEG